MTLPKDPIKREAYLHDLRTRSIGKKASQETKTLMSKIRKGVSKKYPQHATFKFVCLNCGIVFERTGKTKHRNKYCSMECTHAYMSGKGHPRYKKEICACTQCGIEMMRSPSYIKGDVWGNFCSNECRGLWKSEHIKGDIHPQWKGGITPLNVQIRNCPKGRAWTLAVLKRDNYTCQLSGKRGGDHEPHHIISLFILVAKYKITTIEEAYECEALWDLDNGITITKKIHQSLHNHFGDIVPPGILKDPTVIAVLTYNRPGPDSNL